MWVDEVFFEVCRFLIVVLLGDRFLVGLRCCLLIASLIRNLRGCDIIIECHIRIPSLWKESPFKSGS